MPGADTPPVAVIVNPLRVHPAANVASLKAEHWVHDCQWENPQLCRGWITGLLIKGTSLTASEMYWTSARVLSTVYCLRRRTGAEHQHPRGPGKEPGGAPRF